MKRAFWALPVIFLLGVTTAQASPIVVSAGQSVTFNFDFLASGVVPPPPYPAVTFNTGLVTATLDGGDAGSYTAFADLNGAGAQLFSFVGLALLSRTDPLLGDGVFSVVLSVTTGSITVDPWAFGIDANATQITANVAPLGPAAVPEPATLTLLGSGMAAAALRRRRR